MKTPVVKLKRVPERCFDCGSQVKGPEGLQKETSFG
ncbi:unnamed protein product, partial [Commensalibacter papalotli (ex Botero et al. 2024)]